MKYDGEPYPLSESSEEVASNLENVLSVESKTAFHVTFETVSHAHFKQAIVLLQMISPISISHDCFWTKSMETDLCEMVVGCLTTPNPQTNTFHAGRSLQQNDVPRVRLTRTNRGPSACNQRIFAHPTACVGQAQRWQAHMVKILTTVGTCFFS
jgi:hypothetical protein